LVSDGLFSPTFKDTLLIDDSHGPARSLIVNDEMVAGFTADSIEYLGFSTLGLALGSASNSLFVGTDETGPSQFFVSSAGNLAIPLATLTGNLNVTSAGAITVGNVGGPLANTAVATKGGNVSMRATSIMVNQTIDTSGGSNTPTVNIDAATVTPSSGDPPYHTGSPGGNIFLNATGSIATTTTITLPTPPVVFGQPATFVIAVTGSTPTGTVTLYDNNTPIATGLLNASGQATIITSGLSIGTHANIKAVYGGDATFAGSTSAISPPLDVVPPSFSDNFVRNSYPSPLGPNWIDFGVLNVSTFNVISTNQAVSPGTGQNVAIVNGFGPADVSVSANVTPKVAAGHYAGVIARRDNNGNEYAGVFRITGGLTFVALQLIRGKSVTNLASVVMTSATSGVLRLDVIGTSLKLYLDGTLVAKATNTVLTAAGGVGMIDNGGQSKFAAFSAYQIIPALLPFADNFNRPASKTLGAPWSVDEGGFTMSGPNQAVATATGTATNPAPLDAASIIGVLTGSVTVTTTMTGFGGGVLADWNSATQSGYAVILNSSTTLTVYNIQNGQLGSAAFTWTFSALATTNTLQVTVSGTTLTPTINGTGLTPVSFTDPTSFAAGSVGIVSTGGTIFTSFSAQ
jgi:hypothetical protein